MKMLDDFLSEFVVSKEKLRTPPTTTPAANSRVSTRTSSSSTSTLDALKRLVTAIQVVEYSLRLPYADALDLHDAMTTARGVIELNERKVGDNE